MLADKLNTIGETHTKCRVGRVCDDLPNDDRIALLGAISNKAIPIRSIVRILSEEGVSVSRDSIDAARRCSTGLVQCRCNIFPTKEQK